MKSIQMKVGTRFTNSYHLILAACTEAGIGVTRRQKGYTNFSELQALVTAGYLERKSAGPRGGQRWFATPAGIEATERAEVTA